MAFTKYWSILLLSHFHLKQLFTCNNFFLNVKLMLFTHKELIYIYYHYFLKSHISQYRVKWCSNWHVEDFMKLPHIFINSSLCGATTCHYVCTRQCYIVPTWQCHDMPQYISLPHSSTKNKHNCSNTDTNCTRKENRLV